MGLNKKLPSWLVLTLIGVVVAALLGTVDVLTRGKIKLNAEQQAVRDRQAVFADADEFRLMELEEGSSVDACYEAYRNGQLVGYVTQLTVTGCQGPVEVLTGFDLNGGILAVQPGRQKFKETPGLGSRVQEAEFRDQFTGRTIPLKLKENIDAVTGATISCTAVIECVNRALRAAEPYLDKSKAEDIAPRYNLPAGESAGAAAGSGTTEPAPVAAVTPPTPTTVKADTVAQKVETGSGVTVYSAQDWSAQYPEVYKTYMQNQENSEVTDYLEDYPMLRTLYEGYGFAISYSSARGHFYDIDDITETGRPHALANCFTCKTPNFTAMVNEKGDEAYRLAFDDVMQQVNEGISCYNCHANRPGTVTVTHSYLTDAVGDDFEKIDACDLACGQCHVEYYFDPETKATTLPHTSLASMHPDEILNYYNNVLLVDGQPFADWTNPRTGVRQIKVQHPEFETWLLEGSPHRDVFTCADCHMPDGTKSNGAPFKSHYLTSPLDNPSLIANNCSKCHADLVSEVHAVQEKVEERTNAVGYALQELTDKLAEAAAGGAYTDAELDAIRSVARDAQFYWDFVFVENAEGAHNPSLTYECLDKAEALTGQAMGMFKS